VRGKNLPPGLQIAIKRGTVSEIMRAENASVDVDTYIWEKQAYWKKDRDRLLKEGRFKLLECSFHANESTALFRAKKRPFRWRRAAKAPILPMF
jgi:hypothetical protein